MFRDNVIYYATKREMTFKDLANKSSRYVEASIRPSYDDGGYISKLFYQILNDSGFINFCVDKQIDANEKSYTIISHILLKK